MKEYIKYFGSEEAANGYKIVDIPFISSIETTGGTFVNLRTTEEDKQISIVDGQPEVKPDYRLRFVSNGNSSVGLAQKSTGQTVEYSFDGEIWNGMTTATTMVELTDRQIMYVRGRLDSNNTYSSYSRFKMTGNISIKGNLNYLWNYDNLDAPLLKYCGFHLFSGCTAITDASKLVLPATTLADSCYNSMFESCTSLTTAPELPATALKSACYGFMFDRCTSLTTAPELPATALANSCYNYMFEGCTSLTTAPELPATALKSGCYSGMFVGCTGLTTAPTLPATALTSGCYASMFADCASLTTAPELPATALEMRCYEYMFVGCTSLTTAPTLPATALTTYCYQGMFRGCTNLNYIKCLATDISASSCTSDWVNRVAANGTFVKNPSMSSWTTGSNGIPSGWIVEDAQ